LFRIAKLYGYPH